MALLAACQSADGSQLADPSNESTGSGVATTLAPMTAPTTATTIATTTTAAPTTTVAETTTTVAETTTTVAETTTIPETTTTVPATTTVPTLPQVDPAFRAIGNSDGEEAARIQQRLLDLGFWHSGVDGDYGSTTKQAVLAFQKYYGLERTGSVDGYTAALLASPLARVQAQATEGTLVEVDKDRQVLLVVSSGITLWALNASSGNGQYYLEENQKKPGTWESGRSVTPSGTFAVNRERPDGWWDGDLGKIYRPKYFNGGIAIHGSGSIPAYPASHGCVRVSTAAMDMIWDSGLVPKGTTVVVLGNDVEPTGPKPTLPPPTTAPPTTLPPETTVPPQTTLPPETTVAPPPTETSAGAPVDTTAVAATETSAPPAG